LGRVQFKAAWKRIQELLEAGYDFKSIHRMLTDERKLTICYSAFCDYLAKVKRDENSFGKPQSKGSPIGRACPSKPEPFSIDRSRPAEELM
jgi:hypothetical protein